MTSPSVGSVWRAKSPEAVVEGTLNGTGQVVVVDAVITGRCVSFGYLYGGFGSMSEDDFTTHFEFCHEIAMHCDKCHGPKL